MHPGKKIQLKCLKKIFLCKRKSGSPSPRYRPVASERTYPFSADAFRKRIQKQVSFSVNAVAFLT